MKLDCASDGTREGHEEENNELAFGGSVLLKPSEKRESRSMRISRLEARTEKKIC